MSGDPARAGAEPADRVESLIERLGRVADPESLALARELVRAVLELHKVGLARALELLPRAEAEALAGDGVVSKLLLLHGLHPGAIEARVRAALERVTPTGWTVELAGASDGVVRVSIARVGDARRAASRERVRALVERAVDEAAPDAETLEILQAADGEARAALIPIERLLVRRPAVGGGSDQGAP